MWFKGPFWIPRNPVPLGCFTDTVSPSPQRFRKKNITSNKPLSNFNFSPVLSLARTCIQVHTHILFFQVTYTEVMERCREPWEDHVSVLTPSAASQSSSGQQVNSCCPCNYTSIWWFLSSRSFSSSWQHTGAQLVHPSLELTPYGHVNVIVTGNSRCSIMSQWELQQYTSLLEKDTKM